MTFEYEFLLTSAVIVVQMSSLQFLVFRFFCMHFFYQKTNFYLNLKNAETSTAELVREENCLIFLKGWGKGDDSKETFIDKLLKLQFLICCPVLNMHIILKIPKKKHAIQKKNNPSLNKKKK